MGKHEAGKHRATGKEADKQLKAIKERQEATKKAEAKSKALADERAKIAKQHKNK
jgi:hypothetical protein